MGVKNFWREMDKPLFALAPLANVTDAAFRRVIAKHSKVAGGQPYVTYTEFVSADGLALAGKEGREKLMRDLVFTEAERPIVAQFFTSNIGHMEKAAALAQEMGFDGVDINMGCPDKSIEKQGAGAKLILNPQRAQELIAAAKRGAPNLPVSVKTRLGYNKDSLEEWLSALLAAKPVAIIIHARTRKEMSKVPARWERVKRAVDIRNGLKSDTLILGNGDLKDVHDAREKIKESGADGAMLGRAVFGNPWLFSGTAPHSDRERLEVLVKHTNVFEKLLGDIKNFAMMKKHFKAYCEGFEGAKELRIKLMDADSASAVEKEIDHFIQSSLQF